MYIIIQNTVWCDTEDLGDRLSVKFGPLQACLCGCGATEIPYASIKSYREPKGCCDACCGYGIGQVYICSGGIGLRQHSCCSCCCGHQQIIIEFRSDKTESMCGKGYDAIAIAVNIDDYQTFKKLMDEKLGVLTKNDGTQDQTITI